MDNIHLREAFQMGPSDTGVLINTVQPTAPAAKVSHEHQGEGTK